MHDPVIAASGWRQVKKQGKWRQRGRKEQGEAEAELTSDLIFASWRVDLFFGATELAKKENLVCPHLTLTRWNNSSAVLKALLFCSSERSTLKGDIMSPCCTQHAPLCHHSVSKPALIISEFATHAVIAELTQVISSYEQGHQLPVILEIHRLNRCKATRTKMMTLAFYIGAHVKLGHMC